jgi:hypothetical protein
MHKVFQMGKKRGYMYTLDVFVGITILVIGLVILFGYRFYTPDKDRTETIATDVNGILSNVKIGDVCTDLAPSCTCEYATLRSASVCPYLTNRDMSLMELLALLHSKGEDQAAANIIQETIVDSKALPDTHDLQVLIDCSMGGTPAQLYPLVTP